MFRQIGLGLLLILFLVLIGCQAGVPATTQPNKTPLQSKHNWTYHVQSHDLTLQLDPTKHYLNATDILELKLSNPNITELHLLCNDKLNIKSVDLSGSSARSLPFQQCQGWLKEEPGLRGYIKCLRIDIRKVLIENNFLELRVKYDGQIYDPLRQEKTLRFVRGGSTRGIIGEEGIYLHGGTFWHPTVPNSMPLYTVTTLTPEKWHIVGQDELIENTVANGQRRTTWSSRVPADSLTLVGGQYIVTEDKIDGIRVATYFSRRNQHSAQEHLDASKKFLKFYSDLLSPYPYKSFSVVENFYETGYGMPSYTLMGPMVIMRKHLEESGLGHEILHCWWGNYVYVDDRDFNWCEGITTYLSNYYYVEVTKGKKEAADHRRYNNTKYSTYVNGKNEHAIRRFRGKRNESDEQIGYGKLMMVFHMMRQLIGDDNFFTACRQVLQTRGAQRATWSDFQKAFESTGGQKLDWFTRQWIDRPGPDESGSGAPELKLTNVKYKQKENKYDLVLNVRQKTKSPYRLFLPVRIETVSGVVEQVVEVNSSAEKINISLSAKPKYLAVDPDSHTFRRLNNAELVPCLNATINSGKVLVVFPGGGTADEKKIYQGIGRRVVGMRKAIAKTDYEVTGRDLKNYSLLILGGPGINKVAAKIKSEKLTPSGLRLDPDGFAIGEKNYDQPEFAVMASVRNPYNTEKYLTVFVGLSTEAMQRPARLLFFYGWKNYFVFKSGRKIEEGNFAEPVNSLEYYFK
ncbi:MAG: hypothetical protein KAI63_02615 [Planctomycetes bacterium]|nr:hypothetical protein [Planctomycetota bacterium]